MALQPCSSATGGRQNHLPPSNVWLFLAGSLILLEHEGCTSPAGLASSDR